MTLNNRSTRVLIVDDHPLFAQALVGLLAASQPDWIVDLVYSAEEAIKQLGNHSPVDALILDPGLPGLQGAEAVQQLSRTMPGLKVVAVSGSDDRRLVDSLFRAGIVAFVSKCVTATKLMAVVNSLIQNTLVQGTVIGQDGTLRVIRESVQFLPTRQQEILSMLVRGCSNKEIAQNLGVVESTIKAHMGAIFKTLNVANRTQAVIAAQRYGYSTAPDLSVS